MNKIRVILADDHNILRYGLRMFLSRADDIEIVGEASSGKECIQLFNKNSPDICVIDIEMPHKNGIEVVEIIRENKPDAKFLILSMHSDEVILRDARRAGISGYLLKDTDKQKILDAIRAIVNGEQVFDEAIPDSYFDASESETQPSASNITSREMEILQLVAAGYSSPQIAGKLYISRRTVDTHRNNIMQKLNIHNTASLVRYALQHDLVDASYLSK